LVNGAGYRLVCQMRTPIAAATVAAIAATLQRTPLLPLSSRPLSIAFRLLPTLW
jgi:hypothetical protein